MISGADYYEFIVFTQKGLHHEKIKPDIPYMTEMIKRLSVFFREYASLYLCTLTKKKIKALKGYKSAQRTSFTSLWEISPDNILMILFLFFPENRI